MDEATVHFDSESYDPAVPTARDDDAQLIAEARRGDVDAFAELVRRFEQQVRSVLLRLLDDDRDVEEATQDTFVRAWKSLDRFRGDANFFTWLYRIAVNEGLARLRRKRLQLSELDARVEETSPAPAAGEPPRLAEEREFQEFLAEAVRRLPPDYRAPLVLRDVVGLSNQEVADVLELSVAAAKSRIHRARLQIRDELEDWERRATTT